ncbi:MAG: sulfatase-like hydrolase/transferase [Rikenellaceae bacterium]
MNKQILNVALVAPAAVAAVSCAQAESEAPKQPNVIVILADDLGYGETGAYGATAVKTPNLDLLANGGVRFTDGHCTSATSTPSRYALFTGSYPWKNPRAKILAGDAPLLIDVNQYTMPKMFQSKGYTTAAIGKWHLGMGSGNPNWNETVVPGANQIGFEYSCLIAATNDRVPTVYVENGDVVGLDPNDPIEVNYNKNYEGQPTGLDNPELLKMHWAHGHNNTIVNGIPRIGFMKGGEAAKWVDEDMADYFVDKVDTFLEENQDKPFFLYYGLHQPHVPRAPHSRFVGATTMGPRGDAIAEADWCIGELIANLEKRGLLENTIIVFSSDNGPVMNDGYKDGAWEMLGDHKPTGGLRGGKYSLFDAGTRVPFFVYWKDTIKPSVSDALISQLDLLASFAQMLGVTLPSDQVIDSEPHLDVFMGKSQTGRTDMVVEANGRMAYRMGKYAMIPPYSGPEVNNTGNEMGVVKNFSLYDLNADIAQTTDLSSSNPETLEKMKSEFLTLTKGYYNPEVEIEPLK